MSRSGSLVLGVSGFLGSTLCRHLISRGEKVSGFDRALPANINGMESVDWHIGEFKDRSALENALQGCDKVYHLISTSIPATSNLHPATDCADNVVDTIKFFDLALENNIKKIVFSSSGGTVYGVSQSTPLVEDSITEPICAYGIGKLAIEKYLHLYHFLHGMDYAVLRIANPYGERQRLNGSQGAVGVFIGKMLKGEPIEIWGDGSVVRDYVYAKDVAEAMYLAMNTEGSRKIINIGGGAGISLNQLIGVIEELSGTTFKKKYISWRRFDIASNILDISLAAEILGWKPSVSMKQGIEKVLKYHLSQVPNLHEPHESV